MSATRSTQHARPFRERSVTRRMLALLIAVSAGSFVGCRGSRIASTVTCDGLRALKLGMDRNSVQTLLGPPVASTGRVTPEGPDKHDEGWFYADEGSDPLYIFSYSDRMYADFREGRLIRISSFRKLSDRPPQPPLFDLEYETAPDGSQREIRREGTLFVETFCPGRSPGKAE
jgi:hypothetical protein